MAIRLGLQCKAYIKRGSPTAWHEVGNLRNVTLSLEKGEADITTRAANGWKLTVGTLKEGSVETEMVWDGDDPGFTRQTRVTFGFERGRLEVVAEAAPKAKRAGKAGKGRR
jgi:hypothetical protein